MHNTHPIVSVVIVNWNSEKYLLSCLNGLKNQTFKDFETIIIDNGSSDGSLNRLETNIDANTKMTRLERNLGFAAANNIGAQIACGKWLVLLNADAFPESDWLENLVAAAEDHPEIASFSSRQIQANSPMFLDGAGDAYHVSGMAWRIGLGYPAKSTALKPAPLFSACAAAAMYLRKAFLDVEGFDEDFFSYFEDVDLGFRFQLKGYPSMYVPNAIVHHIGSATFGVRSDFAFYHSHRNMIWTYFKNMPSSMLWFHLPGHLIANFIYLVYYTLRGRGKVLLKAKWDAIVGLPKVLKKRRIIQSSRRISNKDLFHLMQHGWLQPYLLGIQLRKALKNEQMDLA